jgi:hypothetical protein
MIEASGQQGAPPGVGGFRFWFATRRWEWSAQVYQMHGYVPGEIEPTTELLLSHKHPEDREHVAELITRAVEQGEPFSSRHRLLDTGGGEHQVMVVADRVDVGGAVVTAVTSSRSLDRAGSVRHIAGMCRFSVGSAGPSATRTVRSSERGALPTNAIRHAACLRSHHTGLRAEEFQWRMGVA